MFILIHLWVWLGQIHRLYNFLLIDRQAIFENLYIRIQFTVASLHVTLLQALLHLCLGIVLGRNFTLAAGDLAFAFRFNDHGCFAGDVVGDLDFRQDIELIKGHLVCMCIWVVRGLFAVVAQEAKQLRCGWILLHVLIELRIQIWDKIGGFQKVLATFPATKSPQIKSAPHLFEPFMRRTLLYKCTEKPRFYPPMRLQRLLYD